MAALDTKRGYICGYVQWALGTARVIVKEQRVYRGEAKFTLMCTFLVKAESGGTAKVWSGVVKQQYVCFRAAIIQGVH